MPNRLHAPLIALLLASAAARAVAETPRGATTSAADGGVIADDPDDTALEADAGALEAVVSGRHEAAPVVEAVKVVRTEQAQKESADLGDVLARTEGVSVQRTGALGSDIRVGLNGLYGNAVRVLVDGIPLEMAGLGRNLAVVPLVFVERVDIYSGVVPITLGADALGGVINIVTEQGTRGFGAFADDEAGSFTTNRAVMGAHGQTESGWFARAFGFSDYTRGDYPIDASVVDSRGKITPVVADLFHNRYRAEEGALEIGAADKLWADRVYLRVFGDHDDQQVNTNLTMSVPYGEPYYAEQHFGGVARYEKAILQGAVKLDLTVGYDHQEVDYLDEGVHIYNWLGQPEPGVVRQQPGEADSAPHDRTQWQNSLYVRGDAFWQIAPRDQLVLTVAPTAWNRTGLDRDAQYASLDNLRGRHRLYEQVTGLAWQHDLPSLNLQNQVFAKDYLYAASAPGNINTSSLIAIQRNHDHVGGAGDMLLFTPWADTSLKASYEYALRFPTPYELFGDSEFILPNPNLQPERSHNGNLGIVQKIPTAYLGRFELSADGFARYQDDLILLYGPGSSTAEYQNVYSARSLGADGALGWTAPHGWVELNGNVTYEDVRNTASTGLFQDYDGDEIPNQPRIFANASARFNWRHFLADNSTLSLVWYAHYLQGFNTGWSSLGYDSPQNLQAVPSQLNQTVALSWTLRRSRWGCSASVEADDIAGAKLYDFYQAQRPGRAFYAKLSFQYGTSSRGDTP